MAKPVLLPRWAETSEIDASTGAANKVEPTEEFKISGLKRQELLPRPFINYQLDLISNWIEFLAQGSSVATTPALDLNLDTSGLQEITLLANSTLTETLNSGETLILKVESGGFTLTYPASFDWGDVGAPSLNTTDIIKMIKIGATVYATLEWSNT